jgi:hypothetical protein
MELTSDDVHDGAHSGADVQPTMKSGVKPTMRPIGEHKQKSFNAGSVVCGFVVKPLVPLWMRKKLAQGFSY